MRCLALTAFIAFLSAPLAVAGQEFRAPGLGAASSFGQGWLPDILAAAQKIPVRDFRDEIYWQRIERPDGQFRFDQFMTTYPALLRGIGAQLSLIISAGHPSYDDGYTPYSPTGVRAFGKMAARMVAKFPAITSIEVGNEFNSQDFVSGPVKADPPRLRAAHYVALLKSAYRQVKAQNPDIRILGGAVHSIPVAYLAEIFRLGGARFMDALAIHPYTTKVEQLVRQIAVLRRQKAARHLPIEVTEFGDPNPASAPAHLLKGYCQMALAGVSRLVWYPLNQRGDGMVPLLDAGGNVTSVGQAFGFIERELAAQPVTDAAPDPFTYACRFGQNKMVIWGAARALTLKGDIRAFDPTGKAVLGEIPGISMTSPLLLIGTAPLEIGKNVLLAAQDIIADSFHQFAYPRAGETWPEGDPFERFTRRNGREVALVTSPGQDAPGALWTPSLGDPGDGYIRLTASFLRPDGGKDAPVFVVHRFRAKQNMTVAIAANFTPDDNSEDGVSVQIRLNDRLLGERTGKAAYDFSQAALDLNKGDRLEFIVGPNGNAAGDVTNYRITLRRVRQRG